MNDPACLRVSKWHHLHLLHVYFMNNPACLRSSKWQHLGSSTMATMRQGCLEAGEGSQDGQVITLGCCTAFAQRLLGSVCLCPPVWGRLEHRSAMGQRCSNGQHGGTAPAQTAIMLSSTFCRLPELCQCLRGETQIPDRQWIYGSCYQDSGISA